MTAAALRWIADLLCGSVGVIVCTVAVAMVGVLMLGGRISVDRGVKVVVGCFIVLSAGSVAKVFSQANEQVGSELAEPHAKQPPPLPPTPYDPYAGAAMPQVSP